MNKIKSLSPWHLIWICVLISEILTLAANALQSLLWFGKISFELLMIGTIDALVVSLIVSLLAIRMLKTIVTLELEKEFLAKDVLVRSRAQDALRQTGERLELSQQAGKIGHFEWDIQKNTNVWSRQLEALYGLPPGGFDGTQAGWTQYIHPEDRPQIVKEVRRSLQSGEHSSEYRIIWPDNSLHWIQAKAQIFYDPDGKPLRMVGVNLDITERKQSEEALRLSEEKLSKAFRASPDWMSITTLEEGRYIDVNDAFLKMTGYARNEVIGRTSLELGLWVNPDDREEALHIFKEKEAISNFPTRFRLKSGAIRDILWSAESFDLKGQKCLIVVTRDITEQLRTERELKHNYEFQKVINALLRLSMEDTPLEKTLDKALDHILSINWLPEESKGSILLAEDESEVLVLKASRRLPEPIQESCNRIPFGRCLCGRAAQNRKIEFADHIDERHEICCQDMIPHGHYCVPILFSEKVLGVINVYLDENHSRQPQEEELLTVVAQTLAGIIIRKQTEDTLQEREERFRTLFNLAADCILIMDPAAEGGPVILEANRAAHTMHGYEDGELIAKPIALLDTPDSREKIPERTAILLAGEHLTAEATHVRKDGTVFPIEISAQLIQIKGKSYIQAIDRDITERKRSQEERIRLESQLLQSQKMEAIGTLAGGVAHDFNNILTTIIGYGNLMELDMGDDDPLKLHLDQIIAAAEKATGLTQSLLAFSRKQVMELKPLRLNSIIKGMEKLLKRLLTEDIEFKAILAESDIIILADITQMDQVLMNLASNARDAMPKGGKLIIETRTVLLNLPNVQRIGLSKPGEYALITITDTGSGMGQQTKEKIFEPFFTTKEKGRGTGLGLSIVYGIIKQHNGTIQVDSEPGKGTVFKIFLPMVKTETVEIKPVHPVIQGGTETILLAEDDKEVRNLVKEILSRHGYRVIETVDGEQAIQRFKEHQEAIDLLLLDVVMPKRNGKEVYEEIMTINPEIKCLFTSGYTGDVVFTKGIHKETVNFITKPILPNHLILKVREVLDK